jgi:putative ABC transport system permease protein
MLELSKASMSVFSTVFFLAAGLGVMNTMLMAARERAHEFGLQKALGASPWRIVGDVALEAWLLGFAATVFGALSGLAISCALWALPSIPYGGPSRVSRPLRSR